MSNILSEIEKIKSKFFILGVIDLLFLFLPGILGIYLFQREMFVSTDWLKLVLLSASMIAPFVCLNLLAMMAQDSKNSGNEDTLFGYFSLSTILSGFIAYVGIMMSYIFKSSLFTSIIVLMIFEFIFIIGAFYKIGKK